MSFDSDKFGDRVRGQNHAQSFSSYLMYKYNSIEPPIRGEGGLCPACRFFPGTPHLQVDGSRRPDLVVFATRSEQTSTHIRREKQQRIIFLRICLALGSMNTYYLYRPMRACFLSLSIARSVRQCRRGATTTAVSMSSTFDEAVDKKAERRRLLHSDKYNRVGFKDEKVRATDSGGGHFLCFPPGLLKTLKKKLVEIVPSRTHAMCQARPGMMRGSSVFIYARCLQECLASLNAAES